MSTDYSRQIIFSAVVLRRKVTVIQLCRIVTNQKKTIPGESISHPAIA